MARMSRCMRVLLLMAFAVTPQGALYADDHESAEDAGEIYEIAPVTVTGTRINSAESSSASPIVVMSSEDIKSQGMASIGDVLQTLTVQSNAINTQSNNGGDGSTRISLRGLGSGRTLVLVNGRRFVPGGKGANSSVDLNAIPAAVIERIEVLKDGASAVYGSDAIGGVVNIITRSEMEGVVVDFYQGVAGAGDGQVQDISVTTGFSNEKGRVLFSAGFHERKPVWTGDRDFSVTDKSYDWEKNDGNSYSKNGSSATPEGHIIDRLEETGNEAWQAIVAAAGESAGDYHRDPKTGNWRPFNWSGISSDGSGDTYNYQPANYLYTPQKRYSSFLTGSYDLSEKSSVYFEVSYTNRQSDQKLAPTPLFIISEGIRVSADNKYNDYGRDFIDVRRRFVESGNRNFLQDLDTYRIVVGEKYSWGGFDHDLSFSYGRTEGTNVNEGRFIRSNVERALGPDADCAAPCVPLDIMHGAGTITQDMLKYIQYTGIARGHSEQKILQLNSTGEVAELPAGPVAIAAGLSSRWEAGASIPDPVTASGNTTGNKEEPTAGEYSVKALYAETILPLYADDSFGIDLSAAGRVFDYDTFGSGFTYEAGTRIDLPQGAALRATVSNAFRAPSIAEMFLGNTDSFPLVSDPCSTVDEAGEARELTSQQIKNCKNAGIPADFEDSRAQLRAKLGGSTDIDPETANMLTAGLVYAPEMVDGLDISVDYYTATVEDEIGTLPAGLILSNCYSQDSPSNCDQIIRDENNLIKNILATNTNVGKRETSGIDIGVNYLTDSSLGIITGQLESNMLLKYDQTTPTATGSETVEGKGYYDLGAFPSWRHTASLGLSKKSYTLGLNWRYIGGFEECEGDDCKGIYRDDVDAPKVRAIEANSILSLQGSYELGSGFGNSVITVGINNILDQAPAVIFNGFLATSDAATYDFLGRYLYLRLTQSL